MATKAWIYGFHNFCTLVHITEPLVVSWLVSEELERTNVHIQRLVGRSPTSAEEREVG